MPSAKSRIPKASMSLRERDLRSRLLQSISSQGILRGTLDERARTCGKSNCKCTRGEKHVSLYVVVRENGKLRHLYVPASYANQVRAWAEHYQRMLAQLEEISDIYWLKVQNREE
jgi:hypothetical protein